MKSNVQMVKVYHPSGWIFYHPNAPDLLGYILSHEMISARSSLSVKEQIQQNYAHGGGWHPLSGWRFDPETKELQYPGDPVYPMVAELKVRDEMVYMYHHAWVAVVQPDGSFEVTRMD